MSQNTIIAGAAALGIAIFFMVGEAQAAPQGTPQPSPPPMVCVKDQCVTSSGSVPTPVTGGGTIKWNPGHYMASYGIITGGGSTSFVANEMNDLNNQDSVLGYRMLITWGAIEPSKGQYDFSAIDAALTRLKTAYNKPKRLVIMLVWYSPRSFSQGDGSVIPKYIQDDSSYGASPVAGTYGWWGKNANGASTGMYAPSVYYPPVMDRLIATVQALGHHLDADPNVEALFIQENSAIVQAAAGFGANDPHYNDGVWLAQQQRLLTAATAAFPHTSVIMGNAYFSSGVTAVALEQWMADNRIAAGTADTLGQSGISTYGYAGVNDGLQAYLGVNTRNGGTIDLRPKMAAMFDVESGDMSTNYFRKYGGPFTPLDILHSLNQTFQATHAFWTRMVSGNIPDEARWSNLVQMLQTNPLTNTTYPANYPK